jgi:phage tail sheath gpL-like
LPDDISLLSIPVDLRDPGSYIEYDNSKALSNLLPAMPRRILAFGQRLTAGTVAANVPTRMFGADDGKAAFGRGSMLAAIVAAKFNADPNIEMWAIASDEAAGGVKAVINALMAGTATQAGTATLYIGGTPVTVAVASGMTAAALATAFVAAIAALPDLPVTSAVDGSAPAQVDITVRWKGASGNDLDIRTHLRRGDGWPAGLTCAISVGTAGTTNPTLTGAITAMGNRWFTDVIMPYTDATSLAAIGAEMERRFGSAVQQDGMIYSASALSTGALATLGGTLNEKLQAVMGVPVIPTTTWELAAITCAVAAYYLSIDPAAPLDGLPLPGVIGPAAADQLQHTDREALLHDGISTVRVDDGGNVTINRLITTYQTNPQGIADISYLSVETMATLAYLRYWVRARVSTNWARFKLADDPVGSAKLPSGKRVTCPKLIKADLIAGSGQLYDAGIIDDPDQFAALVKVQRSGSSPDRVNSLLPWKLIGQFRVFAGQIQFRL